MENTIDRLKTLVVADIMSRKVVWVSSHQRMADVAALLLKHGISSAPVVDDKGSCVGVISATDVLRRDSSFENSEYGNHHAKPAWAPDDIVATFMTTGVQSIGATASLMQAARVICAQRVHRLPVVDHKGHPIGVVSTIDIVSALTNAEAECEL